MDHGFNLDAIHIEESLLQALEDTFTQLELAFQPRDDNPLIFDLGISRITLDPKSFDRLVNRCIVDRKDNSSASTFVSSEDTDLFRLGLISIKDKDDGVYYFMDSPTTSATTYDVSITHTGRVILKLAGTMAIIESVIRQGLFSVLEAIVPMLSREWLPALLAHENTRVRDLAAECLSQLEEE